MGNTIRLDKYLTEMKKGSRSQVKEAAKKGRITVNGQIEKKTDRKIDPVNDQVTYDGQVLVYQAYEYYMLNKPQGVVSATQDNLHKTVLELLDSGVRTDLFPVGRLDLDTEGLLILTNDGALAHRLLAPKNHVDKVYFVRWEGKLPADAALQIEAGMTLTDGTVVQPARLTRLDDQTDHTALLTIGEGKFHQVKRMFQVLGCQVTFLKRMSMGGVSLDETLLPGAYRPLTQEELATLRKQES